MFMMVAAILAWGRTPANPQDTYKVNEKQTFVHLNHWDVMYLLLQLRQLILTDTGEKREIGASRDLSKEC
jgi:hypothetical protein